MRLSQLLKEYRREHKLSQQLLADKIGVSKQYISMLENEKNSRSGNPIAPSVATMKKISEGLNIPINTLLTQLDGDQIIDFTSNSTNMSSISNNINFANNSAIIDTYQNYSSYTYIPIGVSAGTLKTIEGLSELPTIQLPDCMMGNYAGNTDVFIMHVNGDSMNRLFNDGDSIMCTPLPSFSHIENGDVVVVELHGEYTVKYFFNDQTNNRVILRPDSTNPIHTDIILSYEQAEELQLIGIVVMCCKYI